MTQDESDFIFEQPLNERYRTFLRLDFLYNQALHHNSQDSHWASRAAVAALLEILAITARGDTRADVMKELERQLAILNEYQRKKGVDVARLRDVMSNLMRIRNELLELGANFMQPLKESEFLAAIKHRSAIPGGTCEFDLPDYYFWLNQPAKERVRDFSAWLALLRPLFDAIAEVLWIVRQNGRAREELANEGVIHINLDRDANLQLLRIAVPRELGLFPEVSGSHYRCSIRFMCWQGLGERSRQYQGDVRFRLISCS
ncbi:MAG: cell division protein ZapD [Steroidobacteraceae bacterium]